MYCHNCGKPLPEGAKFCPACGAEQRAWNAGAGGQSAPPPSPGPGAARQAGASPAAAPAKKRRLLSPGLLVAVIVIGVILWGLWPSPLGSKENSEVGNDFLKALKADHLAVDADTRVIVDGRALPEKFADEQIPDMQTQLDDAIRDMAEHILVVSFDELISFDTMGQAFAYPYFWIDADGISVSDLQWVSWEGEMTAFRYYTLEYNVDADGRDAMQSQIDAAVEQYMALIPTDADEWQAAKIVHDEMVRRITYDQSMSRTHRADIYGGLVENSAVCSGYTYTFSYLMHAWDERAGRKPYQSDSDYWQENFGTNCYPAVMSEDHGWNLIYSVQTPDGNLDVTWDDLDVTDKYGQPYILYNYFGLTSSEISLVDSHIRSGSRLFTMATGGADGETFNYHKHEGYYLTAFDLDAITSAFARQYAAGSNVLTVRFADQADFARIKAWAGTNAQECYQVLASIGYSGTYASTSADELLTFNILLDYPDT